MTLRLLAVVLLVTLSGTLLVLPAFAQETPPAAEQPPPAAGAAPPAAAQPQPQPEAKGYTLPPEKYQQAIAYSRAR
jgi:hypothetical protein